MELFQKISIRNEITDELLEKAKLYRDDPLTAKIKPE